MYCKFLLILLTIKFVLLLSELLCMSYLEDLGGYTKEPTKELREGLECIIAGETAKIRLFRHIINRKKTPLSPFY